MYYTMMYYVQNTNCYIQNTLYTIHYTYTVCTNIYTLYVYHVYMWYIYIYIQCSNIHTHTTNYKLHTTHYTLHIIHNTLYTYILELIWRSAKGFMSLGINPSFLAWKGNQCSVWFSVSIEWYGFGADFSAEQGRS